MTVFEIILIGVGLAMDAVAVSMTNGMVYRKLSIKQYLAMPFFFGLFQALMPFIGNFAGTFFADIISKYSGIVILLILGVIGGKMVKEGIEHIREDRAHPEEHRGKGEKQCDKKGGLTLGVLLFQAVATSIDAFAVGVGFSAMRVNILQAAAIIAVVTAVLVTFAIVIGKKFGDVLGSRAEILGGFILIAIGIKAVIA
ncbi:MAG: manganese efflux pump MntP family protein [Anaerovoracaceae bacterium]